LHTHRAAAGTVSVTGGRDDVSVRLHVLSDLHLERAPFAPHAVEADVVILAGDVAPGAGGVDWARGWARERPVLYVAGNHEFYGHSMPALIGELRRAAAGSAVRVLENDEVIIAGVRFLGCTLWSDFAFDGPEHRAESMQLCERFVNDYKVIRAGSTGRRLAAEDTLTLHRSSRLWLAERLERPHDGPTVVVTHHAPLIRTRPDLALLRALAGAFASDVTGLMGSDRVALWIYGHTHRVADLEVRGTRVLSNPRGYPQEPAAGFDPSCVIEVG
jgi:predicted phosphodiesterase